MKKILGITLAALLAFGSFGALAEEAVTLGGVVIGVTETTFYLSTEEHGVVLVNYDETTELEGITEGIEENTYVFVTYEGIMTRSIPPQIFARRIAMHVISGTVVEVSGDRVLVDQGGQSGLVLVRLPEGMPPLFCGCPVDVYYSGIMALSYPGQVGALHVVTPMLTGTVTELGDGYFLMAADDDGEYLVNYDAGTYAGSDLSVSDKVLVYYNGAAAKSLPPQIYAIALFTELK